MCCAHPCGRGDNSAVHVSGPPARQQRPGAPSEAKYSKAHSHLEDGDEALQEQAVDRHRLRPPAAAAAAAAYARLVAAKLALLRAGGADERAERAAAGGAASQEQHLRRGGTARARGARGAGAERSTPRPGKQGPQSQPRPLDPLAPGRTTRHAFAVHPAGKDAGGRPRARCLASNAARAMRAFAHRPARRPLARGAQAQYTPSRAQSGAVAHCYGAFLVDAQPGHGHSRKGGRGRHWPACWFDLLLGSSLSAVACYIHKPRPCSNAYRGLKKRHQRSHPRITPRPIEFVFL